MEPKDKIEMTIRAAMLAHSALNLIKLQDDISIRLQFTQIVDDLNGLREHIVKAQGI